jgi:hypothetical protein
MSAAHSKETELSSVPKAVATCQRGGTANHSSGSTGVLFAFRLAPIRKLAEIVAAAAGENIDFIDAESADGIAFTGALCSLDFDFIVHILEQRFEVRKTPVGLQVGSLIPGRS